ncbi:sulfatase [Maribellus maritimus]|uniref:sulfatase n=1 Tax=Maribellus maritimus TaxID=2870838 RepID=UPI001EEC4E9C|nr:sulfatase [Maribellus maritimus]MCG6189378.1 sulfatase [Maribellus maritimus]
MKLEIIFFKKVVVVVCFLWVFPFLAFSKDKMENPKNIVFILVDDLGYSDIGYMKQKPQIKTPNIDKLAQNGMVFTNAYASCPVCSPTRASILTGKYPATLHLTCHIPGIGMEKYVAQRSKGKKLLEADFIDHLPLEETTLAEVLKRNGYKTVFLGKWHLAGEGSQTTTDGVVNANYHPDQQGFDINIGGCAYGQPASYFSPYRNATIADEAENEYLTDRLGEDACRFIEENKKEKFLLYLSFYTVHTPWQVPNDVVKKYNGNKYYAMIDQLDENVGRVLNKLRELNLTKNTLIIFYSDNGGVQENPPLQDRKGSLYEGGIRVPLVFSLPGIVPENTTCEIPVTSPDFFPTLLAASGNFSETGKYKVDGINLWPVIIDGEKPDDRAIFWHFPHHRNNEKSMAAAVREGDWKLIYEFESQKLSLFNLKEDIGETTNLSDKFPEKAKYLYEKLKNWQLDVNAVIPNPNPEFKN